MDGRRIDPVGRSALARRPARLTASRIDGTQKRSAIMLRRRRVLAGDIERGAMVWASRNGSPSVTFTAFPNDATLTPSFRHRDTARSRRRIAAHGTDENRVGRKRSGDFAIRGRSEQFRVFVSKLPPSPACGLRAHSDAWLAMPNHCSSPSRVMRAVSAMTCAVSFLIRHATADEWSQARLAACPRRASSPRVSRSARRASRYGRGNRSRRRAAPPCRSVR